MAPIFFPTPSWAKSDACMPVERMQMELLQKHKTPPLAIFTDSAWNVYMLSVGRNGDWNIIGFTNDGDQACMVMQGKDMMFLMLDSA